MSTTVGSPNLSINRLCFLGMVCPIEMLTEYATSVTQWHKSLFQLQQKACYTYNFNFPQAIIIKSSSSSHLAQYPLPILCIRQYLCVLFRPTNLMLVSYRRLPPFTAI
jgi:hypothetical protein